MKRMVYLWVAFLWIFAMTGAAVAASTAPQVVIDPLDSSQQNKVIQIGNEHAGDLTWMQIPFNVTPDYDFHEAFVVSFDIYRPYDANLEWFYWSWMSDVDVIDPAYGGQHENQQNGQAVYPFVGTVTTNFAPIVFDRWTNLTMVWDFFETPQPYSGSDYTGDIQGYVSSYYDGTGIDINYPLIIHNDSNLTGYFFGLANLGGGTEVVYLDNFWIEGSPIYDAEGFESFSLGDLNGQDGWQTGVSSTVPVPPSILLLGSGCLGLVGISRRFRNR